MNCSNLIASQCRSINVVSIVTLYFPCFKVDPNSWQKNQIVNISVFSMLSVALIMVIFYELKTSLKNGLLWPKTTTNTSVFFLIFILCWYDFLMIHFSNPNLVQHSNITLSSENLIAFNSNCCEYKYSLNILESHLVVIYWKGTNGFNI